jgi:hypothetical protein
MATKHQQMIALGSCAATQLLAGAACVEACILPAGHAASYTASAARCLLLLLLLLLLLHVNWKYFVVSAPLNSIMMQGRTCSTNLSSVL